MKSWNEKGCKQCRLIWEQGKYPQPISVNNQRHTRLYQCLFCGNFWEEHERYADVISAEEVCEHYPNINVKHDGKMIDHCKLEQYLIEAKNSNLSLPDFIRNFMNSVLFIPSAVEVQENKSIMPLFFDKNGESMMAVFTSKEKLELYKRNVKHYITLTGGELLKQIPVDNGLVINPGYPIGFDISADGIKNIKKDFIKS